MWTLGTTWEQRQGTGNILASLQGLQEPAVPEPRMCLGVAGISQRARLSWALGTMAQSLESSLDFPRAAWLEQREGGVGIQAETLKA